uniref:Tautomerase cis-CaaD-like domain-containing protein n=1 Tax=Moniliophthora roreri TaxID=221103 RepID=A0A0W0FA97_MONRR
MPFHRWYCPPNLYTADEKKAIAAAITDVYKRLPAFYVVVNFINVDRENFFVGGENSDRFVRISIHHLARTLHGYEEKRAWMDKYEKAIEPWTKGKGIDWEVQIANMDALGCDRYNTEHRSQHFGEFGNTSVAFIGHVIGKDAPFMFVAAKDLHTFITRLPAVSSHSPVLSTTHNNAYSIISSEPPPTQRIRQLIDIEIHLRTRHTEYAQIFPFNALRTLSSPFLSTRSFAQLERIKTQEREEGAARGRVFGG